MLTGFMQRFVVQIKFCSSIRVMWKTPKYRKILMITLSRPAFIGYCFILCQDFKFMGEMQLAQES